MLVKIVTKLLVWGQVRCLVHRDVFTSSVFVNECLQYLVMLMGESKIDKSFLLQFL